MLELEPALERALERELVLELERALVPELVLELERALVLRKPLPDHPPRPLPSPELITIFYSISSP